MSDNLAKILVEAAEAKPDGIAVKLDDTEVSYGMLNEGSARLAALLKEKGVSPGDRVGVMLPNVPYFPIAYYGVLRAGATVVPMNVLLKPREVGFYLEDPGANIVIAWGDFAEAAEKGAEDAGAEVILVKPGEFEKLLADQEPDHDLADRDPEDTAVILYTSGTTGKPKGAELTHSNLLKNCTIAADDAGRDLRGRQAARRAAAVPLLRADLHPERRHRQPGDDLDDPAVRRRQGAGDHRARQDHAVPGRADDVQRDARGGQRRLRRHLHPASVHVGRLRHARRGDAQVRGEVRLQGPRGLRPVGDLAGGLVQPPRPRQQARLHRHPDRGRGDEGRR